MGATFKIVKELFVICDLSVTWLIAFHGVMCIMGDWIVQMEKKRSNMIYVAINKFVKTCTKQICIHLGSVCNSQNDCPLGDDELFCDLKDRTCLPGCHCLLYGLFCIQTILHTTGREWLIRSHSSARFCFELSGNSN